MTEFIVGENEFTGDDVLTITTEDGSIVLGSEDVIKLALTLIDEFPGLTEVLEEEYLIYIQG